MRLAPALLAPAWLALAGCAVNQLRIDDANIVAQSSAAAAAGATAFLAEVDRAREETNVALAVADPACGQQHPEVRRDPDLRPDAPAVGALCLDAPDPNSKRLLSTDPLGPALAPTLQLVEALGAYGAGLAATTGRHERTPPSALFVDALTLAEAAQTTLKGEGAVPGADDPRVKAALDLVNFLEGLAQEAATVRDLRKFLDGHPNAVGTIIAPLERQLRAWEGARKGDAGLRTIAAGATVARNLARRPPAPADERRAVLQEYYDTRRALAAEATLAPALLQALAAVQQADTDFRRVMQPDAPLTPAERRQVADLARARLVTAFTRVAALAASIRSA